MTDLIYFNTPLLLAILLIAVVLSVLSKLLCKVPAVSWIYAALQGICIAVLIICGGGLSDVFVMLVCSLIASAVAEKLKNCKKEGGKRQ